MNAGARAATGSTFLFLHADTRLPDCADRLVLAALERGGHAWGRFDVAIDGRSPLLAVVAAMMNARSRLTGIATGDQAIFVRREAFLRAGAFPPIALMEDIAFSKAMKRIGPPVCMREKAHTSGRRWEAQGTLRTVLLMWRLRLAYFLGADPARLAERYGSGRAAR
jgi:rSAM/selenodomain-associated transferase 2